MNRVTVLVDWDTARRLIPCAKPNVNHVEQVIDRLQIAISNHIREKDSKNNYRIYWRMYHGWHRGKTPSADRVIFDKFSVTAGSRSIHNISFSSDFKMSGKLACESYRLPIFDTLRTDSSTGKEKQKMVDTMLVCDLLHLARTKDSYWLLVVAGDDDFVPALYMAEAWKAKVTMLHNREHLNGHLKLSGIATRMVWND